MTQLESAPFAAYSGSVRDRTPEPIGRMAEGVLPGTYELAESPAHRAKLVSRVVLHSLGQGTSSGLETFQRDFSKVTKFKIGRTLRCCNPNWGRLLQTLSLKRSLLGLEHVMILY